MPARAPRPRAAARPYPQPVVFAVGQLGFLLPALLIAAALIWPRRHAPGARGADAFDRRIVTLLAFGPVAAVIALRCSADAARSPCGAIRFGFSSVSGSCSDAQHDRAGSPRAHRRACG